MPGHEITRSGEERRKNPPHVDCQIFITEESRVAAKHMITLMTPENIQVVERWLDRLKKAETSAWEIFVKMVKLGVMIVFATFLYHLTEAGFVTWIKRLLGK